MSLRQLLISGPSDLTVVSSLGDPLPKPHGCDHLPGFRLSNRRLEERSKQAPAAADFTKPGLHKDANGRLSFVPDMEKLGPRHAPKRVTKNGPDMEAVSGQVERALSLLDKTVTCPENYPCTPIGITEPGFYVVFTKRENVCLSYRHSSGHFTIPVNVTMYQQPILSMDRQFKMIRGQPSDGVLMVLGRLDINMERVMGDYTFTEADRLLLNIHPDWANKYYYEGIHAASRVAKYMLGVSHLLGHATPSVSANRPGLGPLPAANSSARAAGPAFNDIVTPCPASPQDVKEPGFYLVKQASDSKASMSFFDGKDFCWRCSPQSSPEMLKAAHRDRSNFCSPQVILGKVAIDLVWLADSSKKLPDLGYVHTKIEAFLKSLPKPDVA